MTPQEIRDITGMVARVAPVGSRITCDPAPADTDEDWLILDQFGIDDRLIEQGFAREGGPEFYTGNDNGEFRSWRRGDINLIVTPDDKFYDRFITATKLATRFNLMQKDDRIALFQAVLYGVRWDNLR